MLVSEMGGQGGGGGGGGGGSGGDGSGGGGGGGSGSGNGDTEKEVLHETEINEGIIVALLKVRPLHRSLTRSLTPILFRRSALVSSHPIIDGILTASSLHSLHSFLAFLPSFLPFFLPSLRSSVRFFHLI